MCVSTSACKDVFICTLCVYMYIVRTRFYTNLFIVNKRKHNDQFSLKVLKKNVRFRFNKNCKNVHLKIGIQSRHTKTLFG